MNDAIVWLIFLIFFGSILLALGRVIVAAVILVVHFGEPFRGEERPMTPDEFHQAQDAAETRRQALREMEIEQESWT